MATPISTGLVLRNSAHSPLGRITLAGYIRNGRGTRENPMRVLGSYALVYLLQGAGKYRDPGIAADLVAGDLLLVFPEIAHTYGPTNGNNWTEFYLVFDGPVFDLWRKEGLISPTKPILHLQPIGYWLKRLEQTVQALPGERHGTTPEKICLLQRVLADALEVTRQNQRCNERDAWLEDACRRLRASSADQKEDIECVAASLGMSYENFRKRFAKMMGLPPMRYRVGCVIDDVCRLLQQRELPLRTVARLCGFCDEFHLSRRFKQIMGISPSAFRRQLGIE